MDSLLVLELSVVDSDVCCVCAATLSSEEECRYPALSELMQAKALVRRIGWVGGWVGGMM